MKRTLIVLAVMASVATPAKADDNKEAMVIRLMAVASFVNTSCAGMTPNWKMMNNVVDMLGVNMDALMKKKGKVLEGEVYIATFKRNPKTHCKEAWELFGSNGTILANIIEKD